MPGPPFSPSLLRNVDQKSTEYEPYAISTMGRIDGTSWDNGRPAGVVTALHVSVHSVEPILSNSCRNLLSNDRIGAPVVDKTEELRPKMAFVLGAAAAACDAEGLTGARGGPEGEPIGPAGETGGETPSTEPREEVVLGETSKLVRPNIRDTPIIDDTRGDEPVAHQVA